MLSIVDEYREDFEEKYGKEPLVAVSFPADFLVTMDYLDIVNTFKIKLENFMNFLNKKIAEAGFFRSKHTGDSFIDIKDNLRLLSEINISEAEALIKMLNLTKDRDNLTNIYKHQIKTIDALRRKKEGEALIARELFKEAMQLERAEPFPSKTEVGESRQTSLVLDTSFIKDLIKENSSMLLLKTALEAEIQAKNLAVDIETLKEKIGLLTTKQKEKIDDRENNIHITSLLKVIEDRMILLSKRANELNKEYLKDIIGNAAKVIRDPETKTTRNINLLKLAPLTGVAALFIFVFLAFFIEYIGNASKEDKEQ